MIYIVEFKDRALAETEGARLLMMSGDGSAAMMSSEKPLSVAVVSSHEDSEQSTLMGQDFWRQPCHNC